MTRTIKLTVLWLLLLAVPFKGVAAAAMWACAPTHHGQATLSAGAAAHQASMHHGHEAAHHHQGESAAHHDDDAQGHVPTDHAHAVDHKAYGSGQCSACAACCVGASAPMPGPLAIYAPPSIQVRLLPDHVPVVGFFTDGPERPPRALLA